MMIHEPQGHSNGICFVGEAPGRQEVFDGKPFVGISGKILRNLCKNADINLDESFITNIVDTMPPRGKFEFFSRDLVVEGTKNVKERLERWKPNITVVLGKHPLKAVVGKAKISDYRGSVQMAKLVPGLKVLPTYHPAFLIPNRQNSHLTPIAQLDLIKAKKESSFSDIRWPHRNIEIINNPATAVRFLDSLKSVPTVIDIETVQHILTAFGVALAPDDCYSITHTCCKHPEVLRAIGRFSNSSTPKIYHNCLYDVMWLAHYLKVRTRNIYFDTMIAQHVCYSIYLKSLAFCAGVYTEEPFWKDRDDYLPSTDLYSYNARDCGVTFEVYLRLKKELRETNSELAFRRAMRLVNPVLVAMLLGVRTDETAMQEIKKANEKLIERLVSIADKIIPEVNVKSPKQLAELFYDDWGFKKKRNQGQVTTDAKAIAQMERLPTPYQPVFGLIRTLKKHYTSRKFYNVSADPDGQIRTSYKITGTKTFRLSSSKGIVTKSGTNLQNQPKLMRRMYLPFPDDIWLQWDLSQAEARIVAALCGDLNWLHAFEVDDVHWQVAEFIYHTSRINLKKHIHRQTSKRVSHATHYLQGWKTLSELIKCTAAEAKKFIKDYHELRPNLAEWHAEVEYLVRTKRELRTPYGNRMIFPGSLAPDAIPLPQAVAFVPQSTCVQYTNTAWAAQYNQIPWIKTLLQVHDSLASSVKNDLLTIEKTMILMKKITEVPIRVNKIDLVIPIDFEIGYDWYNLKECTIENVEKVYKNLQEGKKNVNV